MSCRNLLLLFILLAACNTSGNKRHERLISYEARFFGEPGLMDEKIYRAISGEKFYSKTDTIKYLKGRIYISYLGLLNGCGEHKGAIRFKGDSLFVDAVNVSDEACASETCDRLIFVIENKQNKRFKIVKGR